MKKSFVVKVESVIKYDDLSNFFWSFEVEENKSEYVRNLLPAEVFQQNQ
jgi:hypothetical protein